MKKVSILLIFCTFISCDRYYKDSFIDSNYIMGGGYETKYCLRIFEHYTITNNGAVKVYILKDSEITENSIDSINKEADKFIELLENEL
ncbi:MAG TPA: hypothetical protein VLA48_02825 [Nitrososphaeraceae archaeon]|nr:hypothetical protein [Nitrososphaeraceae archaeon]